MASRSHAIEPTASARWRGSVERHVDAALQLPETRSQNDVLMSAQVERGFAEGWIQARIPETRTGLSVAVIGSGPAGLACADVLNQQGHKVTVYEREDRPGGLLMYGIPNMKLDKGKVERRINLLEEEGIEFVCNAEIGKNVNVETIRNANDALVLCTGATIPRDLPVPGRDAKGIHFAMEFLTKNQKRLMMTRDGTLESEWGEHITAEGKDVIVIGGGDTGTDCIGTSMRHRCKSIVNFELMGRPPDARADSNPWPEWPKVYGVDYGHGEVQAVFGQDPREYGVITTEFLVDDDNNVKGLRTSDAKLGPSGVEIVPDSEREWPCDLVLLAMGFVSPSTTSRPNFRWPWIRARTSGRRTASTRRAWTASSRRATVGGASRWSCGRSTRAAARR